MQSVSITTNVVSSNPTLAVLARYTYYNFFWESLYVTCGMLVIFPGTPVFSTNKTDHHDITEILLKVALNTINQTNLENWIFERILHVHILSLLHKATLVTDGLILCNIKMVHFLCRILVGAPRDFDQSWSPSNRTGALYKCDPENTSSCQQIRIAKSGKF